MLFFFNSIIMKKLNLVKPTLYFSIAGFFIPGITAICLLGLQMGIEAIGFECSSSIIIIWAICTITSLLLPIFFIKFLERFDLNQRQSLNTKLILFNIVEYTCLQAALASFFSNPKTLCYVTDGQNGLEIIFTGWLAIPILVLLSFIFERRLRLAGS